MKPELGMVCRTEYFSGKLFKEVIYKFPSIILQKGGKKILKFMQDRKRHQFSLIISIFEHLNSYLTYFLHHNKNVHYLKKCLFCWILETAI